MTRAPDDARPIVWRCFHCGAEFTGQERQAAAVHFGTTIDAEPACKIAATEGGLIRTLRDMHGELRRYQEEDSDLHREIARVTYECARAVQNAEELGYARGLRDGRKYPAEGDAA